ncbi:MAG: ABC transporter permease [Candidatus Heimdallarchaeaceae archaeon]
MVLLLNLITVIMYFLFSKVNPDLTIFGFNATYFEFVIIGLCLQMVIGTSLATVSTNIYTEIISGTWSTLLLNFNFLEYSIGTTFAGVLLSSFSIVIAILVAYLLTGFYFSISYIDIVVLLVLFFLILVAHMAISMLFASFTVFYQRTGNFVQVLYQLSKTFTGVLFPLSLLKGFPLIIARSLPLSYGLEAMHSLLYTLPTNWVIIWKNSLILIAFTLILFFLSQILFNISLRNAKNKGKVDWY